MSIFIKISIRLYKTFGFQRNPLNYPEAHTTHGLYVVHNSKTSKFNNCGDCWRKRVSKCLFPLTEEMLVAQLGWLWWMFGDQRCCSLNSPIQRRMWKHLQSFTSTIQLKLFSQSKFSRYFSYQYCLRNGDKHEQAHHFDYGPVSASKHCSCEAKIFQFRARYAIL